MSKFGRITAFFVAVAMILVVVCSAVFIVENSDHKCTGADCQNCVLIGASLKALNNQIASFKNASFVLCFVLAMALVLGCAKRFAEVRTIVDLKTKLSN